MLRRRRCFLPRCFATGAFSSTATRRGIACAARRRQSIGEPCASAAASTASRRRVRLRCVSDRRAILTTALKKRLLDTREQVETLRVACSQFGADFDETAFSSRRTPTNTAACCSPTTRTPSHGTSTSKRGQRSWGAGAAPESPSLRCAEPPLGRARRSSVVPGALGGVLSRAWNYESG